MPLENTRRWPRLVSCLRHEVSSAWKLAEPGEVGEARVGREHQDQHRHRLDDQEERRGRRCRCRTRAWRSGRSPSPPRSGPSACCVASNEMPMNMCRGRTPITMRVVRAFFHSGGLNAGTPLEMASTPVMAAPPEAKAWRSRNDAEPPPVACERARGRRRGTWCEAAADDRLGDADADQQRTSTTMKP